MNAIRLLSSDVGKDVFGSHLFSWNWNAAAACSRSTAVRPRVIVFQYSQGSLFCPNRASL